MPLKDQIKNYAKKLVEDRPDPARLGAMVRPRKPFSLIFADDGIIPNNPRFPVIIYRGAVKISGSRFEPAVVIDTLFETNGVAPLPWNSGASKAAGFGSRRAMLPSCPLELATG